MIKKEERREEGEREKRSKEKKEEKAAQREERALQREERSYRVSKYFCYDITHKTVSVCTPFSCYRYGYIAG
jgi:hypothetical protein